MLGSFPMNILARLKISTKILALLLMLGAVTIAIAFMGSRELRNVDAAYSAMVNEGKATLLMARANRRVTEMVFASTRAMAYDGASKEAKAADAAEQTAYDSTQDLFDKAAAARPSIKTEIAGFDQQIDDLHKLARQAVAFGLQNNNDAAATVIAEITVKADVLSKQMVASNEALAKADESASTALTSSAETTSFWLLALSIGAVVLSIGASLLVARFGITGPLVRLKSTMEALAAGNNAVVVDGCDRRDEVGGMAKVVLVFRETAVAKASADAEKIDADRTVQMVVDTLAASLAELSTRDLTNCVEATYPGVYAGLKDNYNDAVESVRTTIAQVSESARTISSGADEIAQASEDLARRTESNAASLEETSAALTQMEGRLKVTAAASQSTVARADQAMATVDAGRSTAETAMQAMGRVSGSAKGIDDVIEGLDKIAFQTRVLAMNAAVEAGRAGDAGRGFAVVADLVSALAMRAEEEAKRARNQLSVTQSEIVTAVDAVGKVDSALLAISSDVTEVNSLLAGMASDNLAQSSAITEIAAAVSTMDRATQQNAAMVEQTSAAARSLTQEVGNLANAAAQFNAGVRGNDAGGRRNPPAALSPAPRPIVVEATRAPALRLLPTAKPLKKGYTNGHANGHAKGAAASNEWSDF